LHEPKHRIRTSHEQQLEDPCVAEYKAMCFSIYGTERVPELMTMETACNFLFLQAHRPTRAAGRKKKEDDLNPKGNTREA
jgi:hypothetical protein